MRVVSFAIAAAMSAVSLAPFSQDATQGYKVAMDKMMTDMHMQGTGDPDKDFALMMMPHHQGAIDMVNDLFKAYGAAQDDTIYKFASDVFADQSIEIDVMNKMLETVPDQSGRGPQPFNN